MAKTKAHAKDGRLTIMAPDARPPVVTSLALDQAREGAFEISGSGDTVTFSFRPAGRKTGDTLAVYDSQKKAERALRNVYGALSGGSSRLGKTAKIIGLILLILLGLWILLSIAVALFGGDTAPTANAPSAATESGGTVSGEAPLPVGEPFPVDDFVRQTQDDEPQYLGGE